MNVYVYYKVDESRATALRGAIDVMFVQLADATGVQGRLMRRRDDPRTWMEVYEGIADAVAFEATLNEAATRTGAAALCGHRVTEIFVAA